MKSSRHSKTGLELFPNLLPEGASKPHISVTSDAPWETILRDDTAED